MSDTQEMESISEAELPITNKRKVVTTIGDFELKKKLGTGATGEVFLARQISADRLVAVKTLSRELSKKDDAVARFLREARSMEKLDHPNIVKFYAADSFKGIHYAAIEYIDGKSIQAWLNRLKQLPIGDAVCIAMVVADALKHAHDQNMVHRDIKPDNILMTTSGIVKVADFGLVKTIDEDVALTQNDTGLGTPLYMAPEQAVSAKTVDQRSDIYSLGATLYHMLTGVLPYEGKTAVEIIMAKERGIFVSARKLRPSVPERLDFMLDKMMAKDPKHRYGDCSEAIRDFKAIGIQNSAISFVDGAEPSEVAQEDPSELVKTSSAMGMTIESSDRAAVADSTGSISQPDPLPHTGAEEEPTDTTSETWYVQYENSAGETVVRKMPTAKVLKRIHAGRFTAEVRAKVTLTGNYHPLAYFPEFTEAIDNPVQNTDVRTKDLDRLYKKVKKDRKREQKKEAPPELPKLSETLRGPVGIAAIAIFVVVFAVLLWVYLS